jgi:MoaA/NifB/PqqE/SkfB family radical SAM enzyme
MITPELSLQMIGMLKSEWVFVTGGEPLVVENIYDICDQLRVAGKKIGLTTNGTLHDKLDICNHVDRLGVSIDGPRDACDKWRGPGVYDKAVEFLKQSVGRVETVLMMVIYEDIIANVQHIIELGNSLGVSYVQIAVDRNNPKLKSVLDKIEGPTFIKDYPDNTVQVVNRNALSVSTNKQELLCG